MPDYYEILGISRQATTAEVRKAYARIAREKHPDRIADPAEKQWAQEFFKEATAAFNALSNERSRREYDEELARPKLTRPEDIAADAYARGLERLEARDSVGAAELLRAAVHHAPGEARYHAALGRALARTPQGTREAIGSLEKAVQLSPSTAEFHAELAELLLAQGLRLRARKALDAARHLAPDDGYVERVAALLAQAEVEGPAPGGGGLRGPLRRKP